MRTLAERLLRDRTRLRRLPAEFGAVPIVASSAGGLRLLLKPMAQADPNLLATARALVRPGDTVWDIGANIGLFSVAAAALAGSGGNVFTFEPDTSLVALLRRTARMQPGTSAPITIIPSGVADRTSLRSFVIAQRARASSALLGHGNSQMGGSREEQTVVCLAIDDCLAWLPAPDVVKIDVEGAEFEVLSGATRLLTEVRPLVACEVAPHNTDKVSALLHKDSYGLFDASRAICNENQVEHAAWNTIAIPAEKIRKAFAATKSNGQS